MAEIRFQLDEHIPNAVAEALRHRGIDVLTAAEAELLGIPDPELLERSFASGRVLVTQDGDFVGLHRDLHPLTPRAPSCLTHAHTPQPYAASCSRRATT